MLSKDKDKRRSPCEKTLIERKALPASHKQPLFSAKADKPRLAKQKQHFHRKFTGNDKKWIKHSETIVFSRHGRGAGIENEGAKPIGQTCGMFNFPEPHRYSKRRPNPGAKRFWGRFELVPPR